jgi:anti-sigma regulatory factor (Ser/Thr protein kinase)
VPGSDEVRLSSPATTELPRLARLTASGLAARLGFSYDEVEDLRLAIDELCFSLIGTQGRPGVVHLMFALDDETLEVEGTLESGERGPDPVHSGLSRKILEALVDDHEVRRNGQDQLTFWMRKRRLPIAG